MAFQFICYKYNMLIQLFSVLCHINYVIFYKNLRLISRTSETVFPVSKFSVKVNFAL